MTAQNLVGGGGADVRASPSYLVDAVRSVSTRLPGADDRLCYSL